MPDIAPKFPPPAKARVTSKADPGKLLAHGLKVSPAVQAQAPQLADTMSPDRALRLIVASCLDHILPNAAVVAAGAGAPEHLHQARVGLRRLRTALKVFGHWSGDVQPEWEAQARALFARLGATRDSDVMVATLLPQLQAAGAPAGLVLEMADTGSINDDSAAALREAAIGTLWAQLTCFAHGEPVDPAAGSHLTLSTLALPVVERLQRRLLDDASNFALLDDVQRHSTRKRIKRLRYTLEFIGSLFRRKALRRCLDRLQPVQTALGDYNDLVVAEAACRAWADRDTRAWFAVGWCAARRAEALSHATAALAAYKPEDGLARRPSQAD